jgi:hypothetical protein
MTWLKQIFAAEPAPPLPPPQPVRTLDVIEREYREAERTFVSSCLAVAHHNAKVKDIRTARLNGRLAVLMSAMTHDPELQQLEGIRYQALRKRNGLLAERALRMKEQGLIR